jgi:hypothetical protein
MTVTKAWWAGLFLLAGLIVLALSIGAHGFGWGDGGALLLLRTPRVLAALAAGLALGIGGAAHKACSVIRWPTRD